MTFYTVTTDFRIGWENIKNCFWSESCKLSDQISGLSSALKYDKLIALAVVSSLDKIAVLIINLNAEKYKKKSSIRYSQIKNFIYYVNVL